MNYRVVSNKVGSYYLYKDSKDVMRVGKLLAIVGKGADATGLLQTEGAKLTKVPMKNLSLHRVTSGNKYFDPCMLPITTSDLYKV